MSFKGEANARITPSMRSCAITVVGMSRLRAQLANDTSVVRSDSSIASGWIWVSTSRTRGSRQMSR